VPPIPSSNASPSSQGDHAVASPPPPNTPLANNINTQPAQPSAAAAGSKGKKMQKKPIGSGKIKPGLSATLRYV